MTEGMGRQKLEVEPSATQAEGGDGEDGGQFKALFTLLRYEPLSSGSSDSREGAGLKVRLAILRVYELVPEAYRQKCRHYRKGPNQTHVEFAREKGMLFAKWIASCKAADYSALRELIMMEELKKCLPDRIVVYLNEQKVNSLSAAAVLADEYVLTHTSVFPSVFTE